MKLVCPDLKCLMIQSSMMIHVVWRHMKIPYLLYGEFNVWCKTNHSSLYISILDLFRCVGTFELWVSLRIEFRMATAIWDLRRYPKLLLQVWFRKYWSWKFMVFFSERNWTKSAPREIFVAPAENQKNSNAEGAMISAWTLISRYIKMIQDVSILLYSIFWSCTCCTSGPTWTIYVTMCFGKWRTGTNWNESYQRHPFIRHRGVQALLCFTNVATERFSPLEAWRNAKGLGHQDRLGLQSP